MQCSLAWQHESIKLLSRIVCCMDTQRMTGSWNYATDWLIWYKNQLCWDPQSYLASGHSCIWHLQRHFKNCTTVDAAVLNKYFNIWRRQNAYLCDMSAFVKIYIYIDTSYLKYSSDLTTSNFIKSLKMYL